MLLQLVIYVLMRVFAIFVHCSLLNIQNSIFAGLRPAQISFVYTPQKKIKYKNFKRSNKLILKIKKSNQNFKNSKKIQWRIQTGQMAKLVKWSKWSKPSRNGGKVVKVVQSILEMAEKWSKPSRNGGFKLVKVVKAF